MPDFPEVVVFDATEDPHDAAVELARQLQGREIAAPALISSARGMQLAGHLDAPVVETPDRGANQDWAAQAGSKTHRSGCDAIVGVGGGRTLDLAKLAAARAGVPLVSVPTQLSHDGICSPVAVVPRDQGCGESVGAIAPRLVYLSLPTLMGAPLVSLRAGLGDLLANPLALRDWAMAARRGLDDIDQRSWDFSVESFELVEPYLDQDPGDLATDRAFVRRLGDALVLSGLAMICAGTSRPASGGEHEISHAIDELFGGKGMHGAQVAFGCIFSVALYEEDAHAFRRRLARLGLPQQPSDLRLSGPDAVRVLLEAPNTRPGRYTILEHTDLDEAAARRLVKQIWPRSAP